MSKKINKKKFKKPAPVPVCQIRINFLSNGSVNVQGFPNNLDMALNLIDQAKNIVVKWFIQKAKENRLNDKNTVDAGNIVVPKGVLIKPN